MRGSTAANINFAIKHATGEILKILFMDDFFVDPNGLQLTYDQFQANPDGKWLVSGFLNCNETRTEFFDPRLPWYGNPVVNGDNTTGNPSTYAVRRECALEMDEHLKYVVDVARTVGKNMNSPDGCHMDYMSYDNYMEVYCGSQ